MKHFDQLSSTHKPYSKQEISGRPLGSNARQTGKPLAQQPIAIYPEKEYEYDDDYRGIYAKRTSRKSHSIARGWEASSPEAWH